MIDAKGDAWLSMGSWSSDGNQGGGVWLVELNATTGFLVDEATRQCGANFPYCWPVYNSAFKNVANNKQSSGTYANTNSIEASYLYNYKNGTHYFLFVNYYYCCR